MDPTAATSPGPGRPAETSEGGHGEHGAAAASMAVSENLPNIAHSLSSFSLWFITPISLWFIGDISILNGIITHLELRGTPPCMVYHHSPSHC